MSNVTPFSFEQYAVRTIEQHGQAWFIASDVAAALEYRMASDMTRTLDDDEKGTQIVRTPSGDQEMLVINESGLYSAILRSRKASAKRFKKWVTSEVLPAIRKSGSYAAPAPRPLKALPGLSTDQQDAIKGLVKARVEALPQNKQAKAAITCWSALKSKFGCTYKEIESAQFAEALSLVARLPLEGELLEAEQPKPLELHYPVSWLPEHNPHLRNYAYRPHGSDPSIHLGTSSLCGMDARSPTLALIGELTRAGYDVEACRVELLAMRHQLERYSDLCRSLGTLADRHEHGGIVFKLTGQAQAIR